MPTYQYACNDCGHDFEQVQSFTDDSLTDCPKCEGRLRKIFNAVGVVFKGSGFYRTDSRADAKSASTTAAESKGEARTAKNGSSETSTGTSDISGSTSAGKGDGAGTGGSPGSTPAPAKKNEAGAA